MVHHASRARDCGHCGAGAESLQVSLRKDGRDMLLLARYSQGKLGTEPPFPKLKRCPVRVFA